MRGLLYVMVFHLSHILSFRGYYLPQNKIKEFENMRKHAFKNAVITTLAICSLLAACGPKDPEQSDAAIGSVPPTESAETNIPEVEILDSVVTETVEIAEQAFEDDEDIENLYYKRLVADEGPVYEVINAETGEAVRLPADETVLYVISEGPCYYEKGETKILENGEPVTFEQYSLYVTATAE